MSVYVDEIAVCMKNRKWRWPEACHLVADSIEELHKFASRLGLKRSWYQHKTIPHYDLTRNMRRKAIALGAIEIDRFELVEFIQKNRISKRRHPINPR